MSTAKHVMTDIARALAVLGMLFLCFAGGPAVSPGALASAAQVGPTATLFQTFCGGHDQPQAACHAPNACCRPDQAVLPPRDMAGEPAYRPAIRVGFAIYTKLRRDGVPPPGFRPRAPPLHLVHL